MTIINNSLKGNTPNFKVYYLFLELGHFIMRCDKVSYHRLGCDRVSCEEVRYNKVIFHKVSCEELSEFLHKHTKCMLNI